MAMDQGAPLNQAPGTPFHVTRGSLVVLGGVCDMVIPEVIPLRA